MKILQLSSYYEPESISSSHLIRDLEHAFIEEGYTMEISTPTPTRGISKETFRKYKKIQYEEKYNGQVTIHRFSMFREGKNVVIRATRYLLCNVIQYFNGIKAKNIDIILTGSTPPTQGLLCAFVKKRLKVPFVYMLQDIFPDSLVHSNLTKKGSVLWKIGRKIENTIYKNADKIIVISEDMKKNLLNKGVSKNKIEVISNWIDVDEIVPINKKDNQLFNQFGLDTNKFYVTYAGNLGAMQGIKTILDVSMRLIPYKDIQFLIIGNGSSEEEYKQYAKDNRINNISFFPMQPKEKVSEVYSIGNVSIISCLPHTGQAALPSKTWSIMATGTAVIANFDKDTELQSIIETNEVGIFTEAGNIEEMSEAIIKLYNEGELCEQMGANAREFVCKNHNKQIATKKYVEILEAIK